jgi:hypothetical protein
VNPLLFSCELSRTDEGEAVVDELRGLALPTLRNELK